ncbi:hypothetical protein J4E83_008934 [Alternaria metachromatica]|uniref:uncharacterized protein n=1 Tax=Alternaria metachromatica TaxID=283354 RepID=UPI0020C2A442|nr:uncharacterized protein J4E83_008934 [Alternaria metachromatica]KAI4608895.1 hypothetical protein J4E83_008934 [Alternaria metachromatica]
MRWIDQRDNIPSNGPKDRRLGIIHYGCTIIEDYTVPATRSAFKKDMRGHWIEEKDGKVKIFIRGITEYFQGDIWHTNQWVPSRVVKRGDPWKNSIKEWAFNMDLSTWELGGVQDPPKTNTADTSVLANTIAGLMDEFVTNPAPFMGRKIAELLEKRASRGRGNDVASVVQTILQGIQDAGLYEVLNTPDFNIDSLIDESKIAINGKLPKGTGGIYIRYHRSTFSVKRCWRANTYYVYIGKTVDYRNRFDSHPESTSSYGDLTRNSAFIESSALCTMTDEDNIDFSYLVEQIFVCLLESYRSDLLVDEDDPFRLGGDSPIEHAEAIETALYFRRVSEKVFEKTGWPGAIDREGFGVEFGANYSSPYKEWSLKSEQLLFLRHDILEKSRIDGSVIPISVFRTAKPKVATYREKQRASAGSEINVFQKFHAGKYFFGVSHVQFVMDGTMGPTNGQPYYLVFEVRTDGQAHPNAWSRLPRIGAFCNWQQGRALAVRMEWEYPVGSGNFRFRYMHTRKVFTFKNAPTDRGSNINYVRSIAITQWLFNAAPNNPQPWMEKLRGCAYVLQTVFDYHTQTVQIKLPEPLTMINGGRFSAVEIQRQMTQGGLLNVNGEFESAGRRKNCDTCALLAVNAKDLLAKGGCKQLVIPGTDLVVCAICLIFGRPSCSWTTGNGFKEPAYYTDGMIQGTLLKQAQISSDEVALNNKWLSLLIAQPLPALEQTGEEFKQQLVDIIDLSREEDDLSDAEEVGDEPGGEDD